MLISGNLQEIMEQLDTMVDRFERHTPGTIILNNTLLKYVDLHSFYWQCHQLFRQGLYKVQFKRKNPVIIDGGAHIGLASLFFSLTSPNANIFAFEADTTIAKALQHNVDAFGLQNVTPIAAALWTKDGEINFTQLGDDSGFIQNSPDKSAISVRCVDLANILAQHKDTGVDLLKLDVEGAEFDLIQHCAKQLKYVRNLIIEVHKLSPFTGNAKENSCGDLLSTLEDCGFQYVIHDLHQATWVENAQPTPFHFCPVDRFIFTIFAWKE